MHNIFLLLSSLLVANICYAMNCSQSAKSKNGYYLVDSVNGKRIPLSDRQAKSLLAKGIKINGASQSSSSSSSTTSILAKSQKIEKKAN